MKVKLEEIIEAMEFTSMEIEYIVMRLMKT